MTLQQAQQIRIAELMREHNLTLNGLCSLSGVTQATLYNLMIGRTSCLTVSTIQKLCDALEIDLTIFFNSDHFRNLQEEA